ncbi:heat shock factor 2-binding protein [Austrofundulus limnaeus]|uniref:Heat shock factor 2-binding protein-like n=1 Tax=Austrofundulus limnaeus TaxID=52670 RepID=A0A2I4AHU0_AUSLI|nr:PREDICTED: heat shock factor 2-binding protein-like [Austrofundulus limnaeus]XP_013855036.1 PREDICTED: heat shock factor 2-binding protein-like [Austrofundulus limnaeus]XP_013855037.1 PREDICTED: heat shock factor 2-binding protein-like [Austrofundulus limnaeus]
MSALFKGKLLDQNHRRTKGDFVRVRKMDLEKLTTEVMQLREFLPRVLKGLSVKKEQLGQECLHLQSRLDSVQSECQKEREEKLLLRDQLWQNGLELQQQADFCSSMGSAACSLLWSCSSREETVTSWVADGKLQSFLLVAAQTLESFGKSLDDEMKTQTQTEDPDSNENQFLLGLVGTITNVAAVTCGRDFLSSSGHILLDALIGLLELVKPGVSSRLKVLCLMALYNVSISVKGLKYISKNKGLVPLILTLLDDGHWEVCHHCLRLLQSVLLDEDVVLLLGPFLLNPDLRARVSRHTSSPQPSLRATARQTLEDLQALHQDH